MRGVKSHAMVLCVCALYLTTFPLADINIIRLLHRLAKMEALSWWILQQTLKLEIVSTSREQSLKVSNLVTCVDYQMNVCLDATPLSQLNPKKKIFETIQPGKTFPVSLPLVHVTENA